MCDVLDHDSLPNETSKHRKVRRILAKSKNGEGELRFKIVEGRATETKGLSGLGRSQEEVGIKLWMDYFNDARASLSYLNRDQYRELWPDKFTDPTLRAEYQGISDDTPRTEDPP
jgi:EAL domain-containing protein (putative c-di-GMP-specific phosphodiesterase class I)